jgi:hypothetical protein
VPKSGPQRISRDTGTKSYDSGIFYNNGIYKFLKSRDFFYLRMGRRDIRESWVREIIRTDVSLRCYLPNITNILHG